MAYTAPELLLVGAAQNLVLAASANSLGKLGCNSQLREHEDIDQSQYDSTGLW
jgi:hypothetical protein